MPCSTVIRPRTFVLLGLAGSLLAGVPASPRPGVRPAGGSAGGPATPVDGASEAPGALEGRPTCAGPGRCPAPALHECRDDRHCAPSERCDPCGDRACPGCATCVPACVPHDCATETELMCLQLRPECPAGEVALISEGCWRCVTWARCAG
jgi:hypothetical protein